MIMRVGGRFPYLQELESVTAPGNKKEGIWQGVYVCAFTQFVSVCKYVQAQGVEIFDGPVDLKSEHNNKLFPQPVLL